MLRSYTRTHSCHSSKCNQTKEQIAKTIWGPLLLPFCRIIISVFLFLAKMQVHAKIEVCHNSLHFIKKYSSQQHEGIISNTELKFINLLFFLARTYNSNSIELGSYAVHVSVVLCLCALGLQETLAFLENRMKIRLDEILHFLMIVPTHTLSFHYILGVYFFFIHFKLFSRGITKLVMFICSLMEKFFIKK